MCAPQCHGVLLDTRINSLQVNADNIIPASSGQAREGRASLEL